ncbi:hypothetical protein B5M09_000089 [Aphanomyces astaci]|uniref:Uncharacterized protein n=1 Tax=Aphanomyces astaci TaxID=112090 RepID=A0A425C0F9_APHAT|nr:hypothetical protein B5M09_000089 [Aphanomyces astaci]
MGDVYGAELQHPVFQALDISDLFATIEDHESRIQHAFESPKSSFQTFHDSLQAHRSLHIDNATFSRWRTKLDDAHKVEKTYLHTITQLQSQVMELQHQRQVAHRTFEAALAAMEARISTRLSVAELAECERMWAHERESLGIDTANKMEALEQRADDLQCQLHQTGDSLYQREHRLKCLEQMIDDSQQQPTASPMTMRPVTPSVSVVVTTSGPRGPVPPPKPTTASAAVQADLRPPPTRPSKPKTNTEMDQDMILIELDAIRKLLDRDMVDGGGGAWDQVRSCGVLASVVSIKQRLVTGLAIAKMVKLRTAADTNNNNQVLSARHRPQQQQATPETPLLPHSTHNVLTTKANLKLTQRHKTSTLPTVHARSKSAVRRPPTHTDTCSSGGAAYSAPGDKLFNLNLDHPASPGLLSIQSSRERQPARM